MTSIPSDAKRFANSIQYGHESQPIRIQSLGIVNTSLLESLTESSTSEYFSDMIILCGMKPDIVSFPALQSTISSKSSVLEQLIYEKLNELKASKKDSSNISTDETTPTLTISLKGYHPKAVAPFLRYFYNDTIETVDGPYFIQYVSLFLKYLPDKTIPELMQLIFSALSPETALILLDKIPFSENVPILKTVLEYSVLHIDAIINNGSHLGVSFDTFHTLLKHRNVNHQEQKLADAIWQWSSIHNPSRLQIKKLICTLRLSHFAHPLLWSRYIRPAFHTSPGYGIGYKTLSSDAKSSELSACTVIVSPNESTFDSPADSFSLQNVLQGMSTELSTLVETTEKEYCLNLSIHASPDEKEDVTSALSSRSIVNHLNTKTGSVSSIPTHAFPDVPFFEDAELATLETASYLEVLRELDQVLRAYSVSMNLPSSNLDRPAERATAILRCKALIKKLMERKSEINHANRKRIGDFPIPVSDNDFEILNEYSLNDLHILLEHASAVLSLDEMSFPAELVHTPALSSIIIWFQDAQRCNAIKPSTKSSLSFAKGHTSFDWKWAVEFSNGQHTSVSSPVLGPVFQEVFELMFNSVYFTEILSPSPIGLISELSTQFIPLNFQEWTDKGAEWVDEFSGDSSVLTPQSRRGNQDLTGSSTEKYLHSTIEVISPEEPSDADSSPTTLTLLPGSDWLYVIEALSHDVSRLILQLRTISITHVQLCRFLRFLKIRNISEIKGLFEIRQSFSSSTWLDMDFGFHDEEKEDMDLSQADAILESSFTKKDDNSSIGFFEEMMEQLQVAPITTKVKTHCIDFADQSSDELTDYQIDSVILNHNSDVKLQLTNTNYHFTKVDDGCLDDNDEYSKVVFAINALPGSTIDANFTSTTLKIDAFEDDSVGACGPKERRSQVAFTPLSVQKSTVNRTTTSSKRVLLAWDWYIHPVLAGTQMIDYHSAYSSITNNGNDTLAPSSPTTGSFEAYSVFDAQYRFHRFVRRVSGYSSDPFNDNEFSPICVEGNKLMIKSDKMFVQTSNNFSTTSSAATCEELNVQVYPYTMLLRSERYVSHTSEAVQKLHRFTKRIESKFRASFHSKVLSQIEALQLTALPKDPHRNRPKRSEIAETRRFMSVSDSRTLFDANEDDCVLEKTDSYNEPSRILPDLQNALNGSSFKATLQKGDIVDQEPSTPNNQTLFSLSQRSHVEQTILKLFYAIETLRISARELIAHLKEKTKFSSKFTPSFNALHSTERKAQRWMMQSAFWLHKAIRVGIDPLGQSSGALIPTTYIDFIALTKRIENSRVLEWSNSYFALMYSGRNFGVSRAVSRRNMKSDEPELASRFLKSEKVAKPKLKPAKSYHEDFAESSMSDGMYSDDELMTSDGDDDSESDAEQAAMLLEPSYEKSDPVCFAQAKFRERNLTIARNPSVLLVGAANSTHVMSPQEKKEARKLAFQQRRIQRAVRREQRVAQVQERVNAMIENGQEIDFDIETALALSSSSSEESKTSTEEDDDLEAIRAAAQMNATVLESIATPKRPANLVSRQQMSSFLKRLVEVEQLRMESKKARIPIESLNRTLGFENIRHSFAQAFAWGAWLTVSEREWHEGMGQEFPEWPEINIMLDNWVTLISSSELLILENRTEDTPREIFESLSQWIHKEMWINRSLKSDFSATHVPVSLMCDDVASGSDDDGEDHPSSLLVSTLPGELSIPSGKSIHDMYDGLHGLFRSTPRNAETHKLLLSCVGVIHNVIKACKWQADACELSVAVSPQGFLKMDSFFNLPVKHTPRGCIVGQQVTKLLSMEEFIPFVEKLFSVEDYPLYIKDNSSQLSLSQVSDPNSNVPNNCKFLYKMPFASPVDDSQSTSYSATLLDSVQNTLSTETTTHVSADYVSSPRSTMPFFGFMSPQDLSERLQDWRLQDGLSGKSSLKTGGLATDPLRNTLANPKKGAFESVAEYEAVSWASVWTSFQLRHGVPTQCYSNFYSRMLRLFAEISVSPDRDILASVPTSSLVFSTLDMSPSIFSTHFRRTKKGGKTLRCTPNSAFTLFLQNTPETVDVCEFAVTRPRGSDLSPTLFQSWAQRGAEGQLPLLSTTKCVSLGSIMASAPMPSGTNNIETWLGSRRINSEIHASLAQHRYWTSPSFTYISSLNPVKEGNQSNDEPSAIASTSNMSGELFSTISNAYYRVPEFDTTLEQSTNLATFSQASHQLGLSEPYGVGFTPTEKPLSYNEQVSICHRLVLREWMRRRMSIRRQQKMRISVGMYDSLETWARPSVSVLLRPALQVASTPGLTLSTRSPPLAAFTHPLQLGAYVRTMPHGQTSSFGSQETAALRTALSESSLSDISFSEQWHSLRNTARLARRLIGRSTSGEVARSVIADALPSGLSASGIETRAKVLILDCPSSLRDEKSLRNALQDILPSASVLFYLGETLIDFETKVVKPSPAQELPTKSSRRASNSVARRNSEVLPPRQPHSAARTFLTSYGNHIGKNVRDCPEFLRLVYSEDDAKQYIHPVHKASACETCRKSVAIADTGTNTYNGLPISKLDYNECNNLLQSNFNTNLPAGEVVAPRWLRSGVNANLANGATGYRLNPEDSVRRLLRARQAVKLGQLDKFLRSCARSVLKNQRKSKKKLITENDSAGSQKSLFDNDRSLLFQQPINPVFLSKKAGPPSCQELRPEYINLFDQSSSVDTWRHRVTDIDRLRISRLGVYENMASHKDWVKKHLEDPCRANVAEMDIIIAFEPTSLHHPQPYSSTLSDKPLIKAFLARGGTLICSRRHVDLNDIGLAPKGIVSDANEVMNSSDITSFFSATEEEKEKQCEVAVSGFKFNNFMSTTLRLRLYLEISRRIEAKVQGSGKAIGNSCTLLIQDLIHQAQVSVNTGERDAFTPIAKPGSTSSIALNDTNTESTSEDPLSSFSSSAILDMMCTCLGLDPTSFDSLTKIVSLLQFCDHVAPFINIHDSNVPSQSQARIFDLVCGKWKECINEIAWLSYLTPTTITMTPSSRDPTVIQNSPARDALLHSIVVFLKECRQSSSNGADIGILDIGKNILVAIQMHQKCEHIKFDISTMQNFMQKTNTSLKQPGGDFSGLGSSIGLGNGVLNFDLADAVLSVIAMYHMRGIKYNPKKISKSTKEKTKNHTLNQTTSVPNAAGDLVVTPPKQSSRHKVFFNTFKQQTRQQLSSQTKLASLVSQWLNVSQLLPRDKDISGALKSLKTDKFCQDVSYVTSLIGFNIIATALNGFVGKKILEDDYRVQVEKANQAATLTASRSLLKLIEQGSLFVQLQQFSSSVASKSIHQSVKTLGLWGLQHIFSPSLERPEDSATVIQPTLSRAGSQKTVATFDTSFDMYEAPGETETELAPLSPNKPLVKVIPHDPKTTAPHNLCICDPPTKVSSVSVPDYSFNLQSLPMNAVHSMIVNNSNSSASPSSACVIGEIELYTKHTRTREVEQTPLQKPKWSSRTVLSKPQPVNEVRTLHSSLMSSSPQLPRKINLFTGVDLVKAQSSDKKRHRNSSTKDTDAVVSIPQQYSPTDLSNDEYQQRKASLDKVLKGNKSALAEKVSSLHSSGLQKAGRILVSSFPLDSQFTSNGLGDSSYRLLANLVKYSINTQHPYLKRPDLVDAITAGFE